MSQPDLILQQILECCIPKILLGYISIYKFIWVFFIDFYTFRICFPILFANFKGSVVVFWSNVAKFVEWMGDKVVIITHGKNKSLVCKIQEVIIFLLKILIKIKFLNSFWAATLLFNHILRFFLSLFDEFYRKLYGFRILFGFILFSDNIHDRLSVCKRAIFVVEKFLVVICSFILALSLVSNFRDIDGLVFFMQVWKVQ